MSLPVNCCSSCSTSIVFICQPLKCVHICRKDMCFVWPIPVCMHALTQCFASFAIHARALALSEGTCRSCGSATSGAAHTCAPSVWQVTPCRFCVRFSLSDVVVLRLDAHPAWPVRFRLAVLVFGSWLCCCWFVVDFKWPLVVSFYLIMRRCCHA
jgi:hypothetical protein